jgi:hypothetical protein
MSNTTMSWLGGGAPAGTGTVRAHVEMGDRPQDLASLVALPDGSLEATGNPFEPYRLKDGSEATVAPVAAYLRDLQACGRPATTQRSYGMDLPRWFLFLPAAGVGWDQATRVEARGLHQLAAGDWQAGPGGRLPGRRQRRHGQARARR